MTSALRAGTRVERARTRKGPTPKKCPATLAAGGEVG